MMAGPALGASPDQDTAKRFINAVKSGEDIATGFPEAVSARESVSLRRVKGCDATNLMRQEEGRYTVVWICRGGALGMELKLADGKLLSVETFEVSKQPSVGR